MTQNKRTLLPKFFGLYRYKVTFISDSEYVNLYIPVVICLVHTHLLAFYQPMKQ